MKKETAKHKLSQKAFIMAFNGDIVDARDIICAICHLAPNNDEIVLVMGCNGMHIVCGECCDTWTEFKPDEALEKCPVCRADVGFAVQALAKTFDHGGSDNPIVID